MAICVDELRGTPLYPRSRTFPQSCHLFDDEGDVERLQAFAALIGLKRIWFQNRIGFPHYDLSPRKRMVAVAAGAKEVKLRDVLKAANSEAAKVGR